jgi:hypothetical protein
MIPPVVAVEDLSHHILPVCRMFIRITANQCQCFQIIPFTPVVKHKRRQTNQVQGPTKTNAKMKQNHRDKFPPLVGPQPYFSITSIKISLSKMVSESNRFRRLFSNSKYFRRFTSQASIPPYFCLHL